MCATRITCAMDNECFTLSKTSGNIKAAIDLRELERLDELARREQQSAATSIEDPDHDDEWSTDAATGDRVVCYERYLCHQRYYDDLKHVDATYIKFGNNQGGNGVERVRDLAIEQDKALGKGGFCWDAAFVLGDFLSRAIQSIKQTSRAPLTILELGSGTGLCGMMVAKSILGTCPAQVHLTDLPSLMPLLRRNLQRNFKSIAGVHISESDDVIPESRVRNGNTLVLVAHVLEWGRNDTYEAFNGNVDVVIGADVVASLYDPVALARTMHVLASHRGVVYVSFKERLSVIHRQFEAEMQRLFANVTLLASADIGSRNRNPDIQILVARGKICTSL